MNGSVRTGQAARFGVLAMLVLLATGCELRLGVETTLNRDGGGVFAVSVAADAELLERAEAAGADPLGDLADAGADLGEGWRVRERAGEDGSRVVTLSAGFDDPDAFALLSEDLAGALQADEANLLDAMTVSVTDAEIAVAGEAAVQPTRVVREYGMTPREAVRLLRRSDAFDYTVAATFPGAVLDAGGGEVTGRTVTWTVEPGERLEFRATGERPGPPWLRAVLGAVAGGLVAAAVLWVLARRRRRRDAPQGRHAAGG